MKRVQLKRLFIAVSMILLAVFVSACSPRLSPAARSQAMSSEARDSLNELYRNAPGAKELGARAKGILVFPRIVRGGFMVGGQYGEGTLFSQGQVQGHFSVAAGSWGLQAGLQRFGYALFFMTDEDLAFLRNSRGWEVGVGPSIVVLDRGMATSITSTTARSGVFAFFFNQNGLMAGLGVQGSKISRIDL